MMKLSETSKGSSNSALMTKQAQKRTICLIKLGTCVRVQQRPVTGDTVMFIGQLQNQFTNIGLQ